MAATKIEWCDAVWNPVTGCTPVSEGCANCYAKRMANRLKGRYGYPADDPFRLTFHRDRLDEPKHWRKPRRVFVCSMSDLFHESVSELWIDHIVETMVCDFTGAPQHTYLLLTKRPERILRSGNADRFSMWPNVWIGVTAENQARADERIPILLKIPAAVRFVSCEPMLGPVNLEDYLWVGGETSSMCERNLIHWVICGGETGPGARPMHPNWPRKMRDDCQAAGVPFFFKQWGEYGPPQTAEQIAAFRAVEGFWGALATTGSFVKCGNGVLRVGKKAAGRLLDGREWNGVPVPCPL